MSSKEKKTVQVGRGVEVTRSWGRRMEVGTPARSWYYTVQNDGTLGGWGNRTQRPFSRRQDKRPGGIPMICSVAFLGAGAVYLQGEPILLQELPKGDSQQEEVMSGVYHRLLKPETSWVWLGSINR